MNGGRRRCAFEAVTIRAAARLVRLRQVQALSAAQLAWYMAELTDVDRVATCTDGRVLGRLARRYALRGGCLRSASPQRRRVACAGVGGGE
jgi:hypothetical protein